MEGDSKTVLTWTILRHLDGNYCPDEEARITAVHPGEDGLVRVITVRTASSSYKRPVTKIVLLPVTYHTGESESVA